MIITCNTCDIPQDISNYPKDKYQSFGVRKKCKICTNAYLVANAEKRRLNHKIWQTNNADKVKEYRKKHYPSYKSKKNENKRNRRVNDPMYRLTENLRLAIRMALNKGKYSKSSNTYVLLGADYKTVFSHIESLFVEGMTWSDVGCLVHIDHKIPLSSATTEEELIKLFHYKNLQPLWAADNLKKSNHIGEKWGNA